MFICYNAVSVHYAPLSADDEHSGSDTILNILDKGFRDSRRLPDIVFSGHVHNYQWFTREIDYNGNKQRVPYVVIGTGGHSKLHRMEEHGNGNQIDTPFKLPDIDNVILENYCDDRYGFMRLHVTADKLQGKFYSVAAQHKLWDKATKKIDDFELDLQKHRLVT